MSVGSGVRQSLLSFVCGLFVLLVCLVILSFSYFQYFLESLVCCVYSTYLLICGLFPFLGEGFFFIIEIKKFTYHNINPFNGYSSVAFNVFIKLCRCPHCVIPGHFHHFRKKALILYQLLSFPPPAPDDHQSVLCVDSPILTFQINGIIIYDLLCVTSFIQHFKVIHAVSRISTSFLFTAE